MVECFSVNRKNAEVVCHAERGAAWLEPVVREKVLERISRGRVQVNLSIECAPGAAARVIDVERARAFVSEARVLQKSLGLPGELTISDLLGVPGLTRQQEPSGPGARQAALAALSLALDGLGETRKKEGAALQRVLTASLRRLSGLLRRMNPLAKKVASDQRAAICGRLSKAGIAVTGDEPRLLTEVALLAERGDVTEELHRAASHIEQFAGKLASDGPVGRTLEFLTQELGREFNTLGAKSADTRLTRLVIEAKAELDRIREQLANVE